MTDDDDRTTSFPIAPMCGVIGVVTAVMLAVPVLLLAGAYLWNPELVGPALLVCAIYAWVWLRFRPVRFVVHPDRLEVIWPLRRCVLPRSGISEVRALDRRSLRREVGWGARVGAGGLWGGFGWLWTARRGIVQMYISRVDGLVWIERGGERPWLVTPAAPDAFIEALSPPSR